MAEATVAYNVTHLTTMIILANKVIPAIFRKCKDFLKFPFSKV